MTPQEKAIELVNSFMDIGEEQEYNTPRYLSKEVAKQCALLACNEVLGYMGADRGYEWWMMVMMEIDNV
jgi:hypothetical protein